MSSSYSTLPVNRLIILSMTMMTMMLLSLRTSHGFSSLSPSISSGMRTTQQRNNNNNNIGTTCSSSSSSSSNSALEMAKKKGFGNTPPPPPQKSKKRKPSQQPQATSSTVPAPDTEQMITSSDDMNFNEFAATAPSQQSQQMEGDTSRGKIALEQMRRVKAEERNAELQKIKNVQDVDQLVRETGGEAAVIPEKVAQRMGKRMLPFVGIPLFGGVGAFVGFWYMATYRDMEFQPVLVAGSTIALLAIGLVGITYSMLSASWDPEREGSVFGTDEFSRNIGNIKGGLTRSRDNAVVREQIMLEENFGKQTVSSSKSSKNNKKIAQSLAEKLGDGFD